jgi:hypothetical protein
MRLLIGILPALALAGCGGGGDGDSPLAFTSFDDLQPNSVVQLQAGNARQGSVQFDAEGENTIALGPFQEVDATANFELDDDTEVVGLRLAAGGRTIAFDVRRDDTVGGELEGDPRFVAIERETDTLFQVVVLSDPEAFGFNYLMFGEWASVRAPTPEILLGWGAFGARTQVAGMPTADTATYTGAAIGAAFAADGEVLDLGADVELNADFAAATLGFATTGTRDLETGAPIGDLDMGGTLSIDGAGFGGTASTTSGWSGPVDGSFYGPAAEEAGGVFDMLGSVGFERYTGSFGTKQ